MAVGTPHRTKYEFKKNVLSLQKCVLSLHKCAFSLQMRVEFAKMRVQFANITKSLKKCVGDFIEDLRDLGDFET